ncbi:hypothetical protein Tco_0024053 [Tanacetum coccineum]
MHTCASNSELVEPLPEPERTLNRRIHRQNKRVPFEQRNEPPAQPKVVYAPILDINYFCHFLDILEKYNPMDDEPMWAADRVVAPTPGSAITIPETANEFAIKATLFHHLLSPVLWAEIRESSLTGPELVLDTTDKVVLIKEKLKATRDRQKSYADNRCKPLEFEVGDRVMLKVSSWKGVIRFGKKGKLAPRFGNQSIKRDRLIVIGFVLDFVEFISFTFSDKEMILVIEAVSR